MTSRGSACRCAAVAAAAPTSESKTRARNHGQLVDSTKNRRAHRATHRASGAVGRRRRRRRRECVLHRAGISEFGEGGGGRRGCRPCRRECPTPHIAEGESLWNPRTAVSKGRQSSRTACSPFPARMRCATQRRARASLSAHMRVVLVVAGSLLPSNNAAGIMSR